MTFTRALLCVRLLCFFSGLHIFTCGSLFSLLLVSFSGLWCFERIHFCVLLYLYIFEGLFFFGSCERLSSAGFSASLPFFVCTSFTYLDLYLRYFFSCTVFISACFNLRYRSGLGLLVWDIRNIFISCVIWLNGSVFLPFLRGLQTFFRSILDLSMSYVFSSSPVPHC